MFEKVELGYRTKPSRQWVLKRVSREHPSNRFTAGRRDVIIATKGAYSAANDVEGLPYAGDFCCKCRLLSVKDLLLPWAQRLASVKGVLDVCSQVSR